MKFNKIQIDLKKFTKTNTRVFDTVKIEQIDVEEGKMHLETGMVLKECQILEIKKLNSTWRDVYKVKLDSKDNFVPGDSVGILSPNKDEYPEKILKLLNLENKHYKIERQGRNAFQFEGKLYDFFKYAYDFTALPKKSFLNKISKGNEFLEFLSSREGSSDYFAMLKNWNNVLDLICMFNLNLTLQDLLNDCEILKPRYYSLTNKIGDNLEILVGAVSKEVQIEDIEGNKDKEIRYGHFSQYIAHPNGQIKFNLRPSSLIRLGKAKRNLVICTGTGVAPFISFLRNKDENQHFWVIYGFRNDEDDLFEGEYSNTVVDKIKSSEGAYVTDFINRNLKKIEEFTKDECSVYVCGRMDMQREVYRLFKTEMQSVVDEKRLFFDNWQ